MKIKKMTKGEAVLALSADEVGLLCVAIGQTLHSFNEDQFHPRTGFYRSEAEALLNLLDDLYEKIESKS